MSARPVGRTVRLAICGMGAFFALAWAGSAAPVFGQAEPPATPGVITPADISTPTPSAPTLRLPTPTPAGEATAVRTGAVPLTTTLALPASTGNDGTPSRSLFDPKRSYTVRTGDTLLTVALELGLDLTEMPCTLAPDFTQERPLVIGDTLAALPPGIVCHLVTPGETLASVGEQYGVGPARIYLEGWNRLMANPQDLVTLVPGHYLRVPLLGNTGTAGDGAPSAFLPLMLSLPVNTSPFAAFSMRQPAPRSGGLVGPFPADWPYGSGSFTWPVYGWISQSYRYDHRAVDIAANMGTPVTAADRGVVIRAGWNDQGYGQFVIIDHNIDYLTLYAHLEQIFVTEGQIVGQGQLLGLVGSTGNSTGPHLHFEIRDFGQRVNPLEVLTR